MKPGSEFQTAILGISGTEGKSKVYSDESLYRQDVPALKYAMAPLYKYGKRCFDTGDKVSLYHIYILVIRLDWYMKLQIRKIHILYNW